jgi:hypothetical protein
VVASGAVIAGVAGTATVDGGNVDEAMAMDGATDVPETASPGLHAATTTRAIRQVRRCRTQARVGPGPSMTSELSP